MDNRFLSPGSGIENGGMFNQEQLQRLTQYIWVLTQASHATIWKQFPAAGACWFGSVYDWYLSWHE